MVKTGFCSFTALFHTNSNDWAKKAILLQIRNSGSGLWLGLFFQTIKSTAGEARQSGNSAVAAEVALSSRWASIFWITAGSSILAMTCMEALMPWAQGCAGTAILTSPPHSLQVSMSTRWIDAEHQERVPWGISNTRFSFQGAVKGVAKNFSTKALKPLGSVTGAHLLYCSLLLGHFWRRVWWQWDDKKMALFTLRLRSKPSIKPR